MFKKKASSFHFFRQFIKVFQCFLVICIVFGTFKRMALKSLSVLLFVRSFGQTNEGKRDVEESASVILLERKVIFFFHFKRASVFIKLILFLFRIHNTSPMLVQPATQGTDITCEECKKTFSSTLSLSIHKQNHELEKNLPKQPPPISTSQKAVSSQEKINKNNKGMKKYFKVGIF